MTRTLRKTIAVIALWLAAFAGHAVLAAPPPSADEVFRLTVSRAVDQALVLHWTIRPGHYLYRDKIGARGPNGKALAVSNEPGEKKDDPVFGVTEVYRTGVTARIAAGDLPPDGSITVSYQGCAEAGICYPPVTRTVDPATLAVAGAGSGRQDRRGEGAAPRARSATGLRVWNPAGGTGTPDAIPAATIAPADTAMSLTGSLVLVLGGFFGAGLLLAFTPCVFPMIPILSGMLAGSGQPLSAGRGFVLSLGYVLAVALAYALVGGAAAWGGLNLQIALQTPWALGGMALVFGALALSMFGLFPLELPAGWTARLTGKGGGGSLGGAVLLGFASALVVGPCMTPPLAGALLYVAQTGDMARGAAALFALGLGLGVPLIVFGTFGGRFLPRSGAWLPLVKQGFGFVFLGLGVVMLGRVVPQPVTLALWGALAIGAGIWLAGLAMRRGDRGLTDILPPMLGGGAALAGLALLAMAALPSGFAGHLLPGGARAEVAGSGFTRTVTTPAGFDAALDAARAQGHPILVDFTASWCVTCQEIDAHVLRAPEIRKRLQGVSVIRADLSDYTGEGQALMQRFGVAGPPTLFFIDPATARELTGTRSVGPLTAGRFARTLTRAGA